MALLAAIGNGQIAVADLLIGANVEKKATVEVISRLCRLLMTLQLELR